MSGTLHVPYYTSNVPVVRFTNSLDKGIVHIEDNNIIESGPIITSSQYFLFDNTHSKYMDILCRTRDYKLGAFPLPVSNEKRTSWVLTYSNFNNILSYKWTDIEEVGLLKAVTMNIAADTQQITVKDTSLVLKYDNAKYTYNATLDVDIIFNNIADINNIVKSNSNVFIIFNAGSISSTNNLSDFQSFCKYTVNVTDTTARKIHISKFIPNININDNIIGVAKYWISFVTIPTADIYVDKFGSQDISTIINDITQLSNTVSLQTYGTLTITEGFKV